MTGEQMKETIRRLYDDFNRGDYAGVESILSAGFIEHENLGPGVSPNRAGVIEWLKTMRQAFPDIHFEADEIGVDGNTAWVRSTTTGTHRGDFMGVPPTGKSFQVEGLDEVRFNQNQMTEHWGQIDAMGMMQQLGMMQVSGTQR